MLGSEHPFGLCINCVTGFKKAEKAGKTGPDLPPVRYAITLIPNLEIGQPVIGGNPVAVPVPSTVPVCYEHIAVSGEPKSGLVTGTVIPAVNPNGHHGG